MKIIKLKKINFSIVIIGFLFAAILNSCAQDNQVTKPWVQENFVISTFHAVGPGNHEKYNYAFTMNKEAGIDLVELTFINPEDLDAALNEGEAVGIKMLAQDLTTFSGFQDTIVPKFTEATISKKIASIKNYEMLEGYYVWDEPMQQNMMQVRTLRDIFKKYDPSRLAFSVMLPSYGIYTWANGQYPIYVNNYLSTVNPEIVSFDYYPYHKANDALPMNQMWRDFGYIRKKALELNKPMWFYFQGNQIYPSDVPINLERIRAQMYAALAYGVKGLSYYYTSNGGALLDNNYVKKPLYDQIKSLNFEVKNVGNLLFNKRSEKLYQTKLPTDGLSNFYLDDFTKSDLFKSAPDNLVIGVLGDSSARKYVVISNLSHTTPIVGSVELQKNMNVTLFDKTQNIEQAISNSASSLSLNLAPGEAVIYILQ